MAYLLLFGWCFLAASLVPISSEPYYMLLVSDEGRLFWPLLIATLGNTLGGVTTFLAGRWGRNYYRRKRSADPGEKSPKTRAWVKRYGPITMLTSWIPLIGDVVVGIGGALGLAFVPSMAWMALGRLGRYWVLGWMALELI